MTQIARKNIVLLLLGIDAKGESSYGIGGITRLQKLLFLLGQEYDLTPTDRGFEFTAYKAGPYSRKLYDDLEFLENLDFIRSEVTGEASAAEVREIEELNFEDLIDETFESIGGDVVDGNEATDAYEERRFEVTVSGRQRIEELISSGQFQPVVDAIRRVKSKFGHYSLSDLLYYVYTKYPAMATESEIRDRVLRRHRS